MLSSEKYPQVQRSHSSSITEDYIEFRFLKEKSPVLFPQIDKDSHQWLEEEDAWN